MILCCLAMTPCVLAEGIVISHASSKLTADVYQLDAKLEFNFDPEMIDALEHGVSISIDINILIKRKRKWLWDPKVKEEMLSFRLEQNPLSDRYLVTNLNKNQDKSLETPTTVETKPPAGQTAGSPPENVRQFQTLDEALNYLGTIDNHFLLPRSVLSMDEKYICMIKAELNTETLPPAIRPIAAVSKKWQLDSPWYEWILNK